MTDWWTIGTAIYAAVVATGALALEIRRWFESGPRLSVSVMPEMEAINMPGMEGKTYLVAQIANRGNAPTTITHFALRGYRSWFGRLRSKPALQAIVPHPHPPGGLPLPATLQPGNIWAGMAEHTHDLKCRIDAGYLYVLIYASHTNKPVLKRVPRPAKPLDDTEKVTN